MADGLTFRPATPADIPLLRNLAERIWRVSYAALLAPAQIDHMLDWMYGADAIAAEMARGVRWVVGERDRQPIGFLAMTPGRSAELHKLYLLPELQGGGLGQRMLRHATGLARAGGARELRLRVNKGNALALRSYARAGFRIVDELVADIGAGFVMDDYVLSLPIGPTPLVKICGLSTVETLEAAIAAGADQIGLVFFPKSPRHISFDRAADLAGRARGRTEIVTLTVDATDAELNAIKAAVRPDWLQLHGRESPERVGQIRARGEARIMKAVGIAGRDDLLSAERYLKVADRLLFDAKAPKDADRPGGNGVAFDWALLEGIDHPYMLSGGLTPTTVADAVRLSGAEAVDVSSGVETAPGVKDPGRIEAFIRAARAQSEVQPC